MPIWRMCWLACRRRRTAPSTNSCLTTGRRLPP